MRLTDWSVKGTALTCANEDVVSSNLDGDLER